MNSAPPLSMIGEPVGWVLVHSVWQLMLIGLIAAVLKQALRHASATTRYAMLLGALAAMTVTPLVTWIVLPDVRPTIFSDSTAQNSLLEVHRPASATTGPHLGPSETSPSAANDDASDSASISSLHGEPASTALAAPWRSWIEEVVRPWLDSLAAGWLLGVILFSLRPIWSWCVIQRLRHVGVAAVLPPIQSLLDRATMRLRVRRRITLMQSTLVDSPIAVGGLRPLILLPVSVITGIPLAAIEAILIHELAHLRRNDYAVNLLQTLIETLFFYHPAVWWLSHQIRNERENCCDDLAVAILGDPVQYGRALLAVEQQRGVAAGLALGAGGGSLLARIRRLHAGKQSASISSIAVAASVPAAPLVLLIAIGAWSAVWANGRDGATAGPTTSMTVDEQAAWDELAATGATLHGDAFTREHLKRHLQLLQGTSTPESQRQQIRDRLAAPIRAADLWNVPATAWPLLTRLDSVRELRITAGNLDRTSFDHIARMPNLQHLTIINASCQPQDAVPLKDTQTLEHIEIMFTVFEATADERQRMLGELSDAEQRWGEEFQSREGERQHIAEAAILTDRMLEQWRDLPSLRVLRLSNTAVSERGMAAVAAHAGLEDLNLTFAEFTPAAAGSISQLKSLRNFRYANVSDQALASFSGLVDLIHLELWGGGVTDAGVEHLLPLRKLRTLALRGSSISNEGLLDLATLPDLERLNLRYAKGVITAAGLAEFHQLRPGCEVIIEDADLADEHDSTAAAAPTRLWKVRFVDGATDEPLVGITLLAPAPGAALRTTYTSDARGIVEVPIVDGRAIGLGIHSPGWFTNQYHLVGNYQIDPSAAADQPPAHDPDKVVTYNAWRGTIVSGRLLQPDGAPAAGIALNVGVYITNQQWKERLGMDLSWQSWDHGQWPNWMMSAVTDEEGRFETTVPPPDARNWIRVATGGLSFGSIAPDGLTGDGEGRALLQFAPLELEFGEGDATSTSQAGRTDLGDLRLERGVILRGRVVDADGEALAGVYLHTSSERGPYAGRHAVSADQGQFEFLPMHPRSFVIHPDARLRDTEGKVIARDVQAVFLPQPFTLAASAEPVETTIQAVPHIVLEFEWIDRRAQKGPVAYYGTFTVSGQVPTADGSLVHWQGETERITREGREILIVKVPRAIQDPRLMLPADEVVTASYKDDQQNVGPGAVPLGDITSPRHRVIYGGEPAPR